MQLLAEAAAAVDYLNEDVQLWSNIWFWVMMLGGTGFFFILIYSVITGAVDIKKLFAALQAAEDEAEAKASGTSSPSDTEADPETRK